MQWEDITIQFQDLDIRDFYSDWNWLFSGMFRPILMSKFGDLFFEREDGGIYFLDTIEGQIEKVSAHSDDFERYINDPHNIQEKLLSNFVHSLIENNIIPRENECYVFRVLPVFGGKMEIQNVQTISTRVALAITGQAHRQIRNSNIDV